MDKNANLVFKFNEPYFSSRSSLDRVPDLAIYLSDTVDRLDSKKFIREVLRYTRSLV